MLPNIQQRPSLLFLIAINLIPIWGVLHWGWTPFYVFYLFWLETLIVSVFNTVKIIACRGDEYENKLHDSTHKYAGIHVNYLSHIGKGLRYFFIRLFIFFFYLLFIVVFIGMFLTHRSGDNSIGMMKVFLFQDAEFNYTLLAFIINQIGLLIFDFYGNGNYKRVHSSDFASIFDGRQLVIHVAVVLGGVLGAQDKIFNTKMDPTYTSIIVVSIFCIVKSIYEVFKYNQEKDLMEKRYNIPDQAIQ
ncbi:DUF6498-containing protein [Ferruginibacter sp. SUN002]|uniref:DUF6498-containing protein n=1 Tax=Ferruginibacter sp. SUN002 TaxID=2937789 RepID=UPI003D36C339